MGRDAGWLAASACLSNKVDILIVPEEPFNKEHFLSRVKDVIALRSKCFVAVSEGARYIDGTYLSCGEARSELFGHTVLGGAGRALEQMILDAGIASRCKVQDLSIAQRCHATEQSLTDVTESFQLGMSAHMHTADPSFTGRMVSLKRLPTEQYAVSCFDVDAEKVANFVKNFPSQWLLPDYGGISEEARQYMLPLIKGTPEIIYDETGLPAYIKPYYLVR